MYARVMQAQVGPDQVETFERMVRENVIPQAQQLGGFKGGYWLADRESGGVIGITLFESEEALRDSAEQAERIREESSRQAGLPVPSFRSYEIVASVGDDSMERAA
jgi:hypothetical protein